MKTNKRVLSVLVCIAMVLSMFSSFAYAAGSGDIASQAETTPELSTTPPANLGAKPTVEDIPAPVIDENVIVVDATASSSSAYTLVWDGVTYSDITMTYGTNLFNTVSAASSAITAGDTVLVFSQASSTTYTVEGITKTGYVNTNFTKGANYYTPAWNIMPYITNGNADGTGWQINPEFVEKSVFFRYCDLGTSYLSGETLNLYGWGTGYYMNIKGRTSVDFSLGLYNFLWYPSSGTALFYNNAADIPAWTGNTSLTFKNLGVFGTRAVSIFTKNAHLAQNTVFDGVYYGGNASWTPVEGSTWYQNAKDRFGTPSKATFTMKNCNFQPGKLKGGLFLQIVDENGMNNGGPVTFTFENNVFNDSLFGYKHSSGVGFAAFLPLKNQANGIDVLSIRNNIIIDSDGSDIPLIGNRYMNRCKAVITDNKIVGYSANLGTDPASTTVLDANTYSTAAGSTVDNNFVDSDFDNVGEFCYLSGKDGKQFPAKDYYLDANMSLKATDLAKGIDIKDGMIIQDGLKIKAYIPAGVQAPEFVLPSNTTVEYDLASSTATITKTIDSTAYSATYSFEAITLTAKLIKDIEDATGLIDADKILVVDYEATKGAANGALVETTWKGVKYNAIKGLSAFDSIADVKTYAGANGIENPSILIKAEKGSGDTVVKGDAEFITFTADFPAKYFTQNYDKKPYTASDRALDPTGSQWASNVNTGAENSFNTADGFKVRWLAFNTAPAGRYEFYGFTLTNTIQSQNYTRTESIDVHIENLYVPSTSNGLFSTTESYLNAYATANTFKDKMYVKNVYLDGTNGTAKNGLFQNDDTFTFTYMTLDGVFADFGGYVSGSNHWINSYYDDHCFTIKNSNLRNAHDKIMFQGDNGKGVNKGTADATYREYEKKMIFENNIFYNFTFSTDYATASNGFMYVKTTYHTTLLFNDNFVYTGKNTALNLFTGPGGGDRQPNTYITVNNNTLLGINDTYSIGRWVSTVAPHESRADGNYVTPTIYSESDVLAGNITSAGSIYNIPNSNYDAGGPNHIIKDANAYVDYAKTTKIADVIDNAKVFVPNGGYYLTSKLTKTTIPSAEIYLASTDAADKVIANGKAVKWYTTAGAAVDGSTITKASVGTGASYVMGIPVTINGVDYDVKLGVTVKPNTVTGYAASTYANGTPSHPTEKTTLEDIAHFPTGFEDKAGLINGDNAAFIDSETAYKSATYFALSDGDYKVMSWNDEQYVTIYGKTLFRDVDRAYTALTAKGVETPEYLLSGSEWGFHPGSYYGGSDGKYIVRSPGKFFTENYATNPYIKGDAKGEGWTSNVGTGEGQFDPDKTLKAAYITIENDSKAGRYELYGFTVGTGIKDIRTTSTAAIDLYLKNTYFSCETENSYIFSTDESKNTAVMNGSPDSKLYIDNAYLTSKGDRSFLRNSAWADITFDAVYADFAQNIKTATSYFHQTFDNSQLVIKNSFFTNNFEDKTYFEGYNNGTSSYKGPFNKGRKAIVLENNIFKDFSFNSTSSFMIVKGGFLSEIVIKNNYFNNQGKNTPLITGLDTSASSAVDPEFKLIVEDNTFIGFSNTATCSTRVLSADSSVAKNYTSTDAAVLGVQLSVGALTGDYYLDPAREILASDYQIDSWTSDKSYIEVDNANLKVSYKISKGGKFDTSALVLGDDNMTAKFYADAELTTEIADITGNTKDVYLVIDAVNSEGFDLTDKVYAVDVEVISDKFFKDVYVVPSDDTIKTPIDKSKAIIVDYASKDTPNGTIFTTTWKGVEYDFIKGETAFATFAELNAYLDSANIEYPHVLMKTVSDGTYAGTEEGKQDYSDIEAYGDKSIRLMVIKHHGAYYTENYNIMPYTVTDGVWARNPEFKHENGIVARWIKNDPKLGTGTYELYGFSVISAFQIFSEGGEGRTDEIPSMYVENGYTIGDNSSISPSSAPAHGHNDYTWKKNNAAAGEIYLKNVYTDPSITTNALLYSGSLPGKVTFDGVFVDGGNHLYKKENDLNIYIDAFELNIINCYIKDSKSNLVIRDRADANAEKEFKINIQNTVLDNATFGGESIIKFNDGVTAFTFENNTVKNVQNVDFISYVDTDTHNETLDLTIKNNVLAGVNGAINAGDNVNIVEVSGNNFAGSWNKDGTEVGDQITIAGTDYANTGYWLIFDGENFSKPANVKYDMQFVVDENTKYAEGENVSLDIFVEKSGDDVINLYDYISEAKYNTVKAYADEDCIDELDPKSLKVNDSLTVYLKYCSHDKTTAYNETPWVLSFTTVGSDVTMENSKAPSGPVTEADAPGKSETHTWLSWKATATGTQISFIPDGKPVAHRVGVIYAPNNLSGQEDAGKAALEAFVAGLNDGTYTLADFDTVVAGANAGFTTNKTNVKLYTIAENNAPTWDSATGSYSYYFNVAVKHGSSRGTSMFAIYYDDSENVYKITYSDFVDQTSKPYVAPSVDA